LIHTISDLDSIATEKLITCTGFQGERFVSYNFLKSRWSNSFLVMLKKQLIGFLDSLADILYGLRTNLLPERVTFSQLGNMTLKFVAIQMFSPHPVIPFVECNAVVIDRPSSID
jgi:hypothetical protein